MARILITGYSGMLGRSVAEIFASDPAYKVIGLSRSPMEYSDFENDIDKISFDLTKTREIPDLLDKIRPDVIIHTAAMVDIKACQNKKHYAYLLHAESARELANFSRNIRFIYISTDSVFDGIRGNYTEEDNPNPLNEYAKSKYRGELETLSGGNSLVLRTNIYGFHRPVVNSSIAEWALSKFKAGEKIRGFGNICFNPLYTVQLAEIIKVISESQHCGILHLGSDTCLSKYDFLKLLAEQFDYDTALLEEGVFVQDSESVKRPENTTLNTGKYQETFLAIAPSLHKGIERLWKDFDSEKRK
ncbi:MAG TPA: SDR family oxidoreductase [Oligoflexia bacterium]|nr:SDR family oxidoreductase [Oligoflexia bacterium]HMP48499.1 SDR family oxidoreductase [Oligoflexia bacterium]